MQEPERGKKGLVWTFGRANNLGVGNARDCYKEERKIDSKGRRKCLYI
jgi:hypothetical protein